ncbi:MAG: nuclear transport factor 2 family protein [Candidatus Thorarchaeota archaeon]
MEHREEISITLRFNEMINTRNLTGLAALMAEDHTFIDISGDIHSGRDKMITGWLDFFESYPDYRNNFTKVEARNNLVLMIGFSDCTHKPLDGPSIWTAKIRDRKVAEWRVYEDSMAVRKSLSLD